MATSKKAASPKPVMANSSEVKAKKPKTEQANTKTQNDAPENDFLKLLEYVFKLWEPSLEALKLNLGTFVLLALVPLGLSILAMPFFFLILSNGGAISVLLSVFVLAILLVIGAIFMPAIVITQLESAKGNKVTFTDIFEDCKPLVLPYIGLALLSALIVMVGLLLFILPGIAAAIFLSFSAYYLVDKKLGVIDSMKASVDLVKRKWQWVAAIFIVQAVISAVSNVPILGWIVGLVGFIVYFCLNAIVYLKISKD